MKNTWQKYRIFSKYIYFLSYKHKKYDKWYRQKNGKL